MKSRHDTDPRQPYVNKRSGRKGAKGTRRSRPKPTEVRVEFTEAEWTPEGQKAWEDFIDFLIQGQLENMRMHFGEAGPIALLKYIDEGKIDPRVLLGVLPPYPEDEVEGGGPDAQG